MAEIEDTPRAQFSLLKLGQRDQVALRGYRNPTLHDRGVAAAQQHGLTAGETRGIGAADVQRRHGLHAGGNRQEQRSKP